jgi:hypothetical protein
VQSRVLAESDDAALMYALPALKAKITWWKDQPLTPLVDAPSVGKAPAALAAALDAAACQAAKTAAAVLCRAGQPSACRDPLFEYGARNHHWIGHTTIDVVQSLRAVEFGGWLRAEQVIATLIDLICAPTHAATSDFAASRQLALDLTDRTMGSAVDNDVAVQLVTSWRAAAPAQAVSAAAAHLQDCGSPATLWQACRLAAAELTLRFPVEGWIKFAMLAVTTTNALRHVHDSTHDPRLRLVLVLQAVAFLLRERPTYRHPSSPHPTSPHPTSPHPTSPHPTSPHPTWTNQTSRLSPGSWHLRFRRRRRRSRPQPDHRSRARQARVSGHGKGLLNELRPYRTR